MTTQIVHFRVGEDFGLRLMEIAMEHLTERNNPVQALKTITESLHGCSTELALQILKGDLVLPVDVESQQVICQTRIKGIHDHFPKVDPCYWISRRKEDIEKHGENLIAGFKELQKQIRINKKYVTLSLSYEEILKFVSGKDVDLLDTLRENSYEVDGIVSLFETAKKYIEFSMSITATMDWMLKSFNEFSDSKLYVEYNGMKGDASQMLTDVMMVLKETLNFEFDLNQIDDVNDVQKYIDSDREIDAVIQKGIEPVDIMENWSAGWLSPEGDYYGLNGEIANMLHIQIADALVEKGMIPEEDDKGFKINPDAWLEQQGWVKVHGNNIQFAGCLNKQMGKKNVDLTDVQIKNIYEYCVMCHNGLIKLGWKLDLISAIRFKDLAENLEDMYEKYFKF
jgi:hypothetical protein